jgi:NAD(P)-dependent dehydrogenase (short-subunit alcohol dehydrogenase family)
MINKYLDLEHKKIVVTGASSGIGRATSIMLSEMGASLIICGRNEQRLNETLQMLSNIDNHTLFVGDLAEQDSIDLLVNNITFVDGIVLVAGIVKTTPFKFLKSEELSHIMKTNFESPVSLCQKLIKAKKVQKSSSIVIISSIAGNLIAGKGTSAYAASKSALNGICKVMAVELAPQKIRVNCISPGMVKTPMTENELTSVSRDQLELNEKLYPLGYGEPQDVAASVCFMLSNSSKWITGTSLVIDGGFSIV